jgi:ribonuclease HII
VLIDLERIGRSERRALAHLDDSKQKSPEEREAIYPHVIRAATRVSVAIRSVRAIDTRGLHVSNLGALSDCMEAVASDCEATRLVDGFPLYGCSLNHTPVVDGDARSAAIAAASVIAKVTRDRYMRRVAHLYPRWNFDGNVGYSTPEHRDAIREHGICSLHRRSFASIAYTQLDFGDADLDGDLGGDPASLPPALQPHITAGEAEEMGVDGEAVDTADAGAAEAPSEGSADVIDIRAAIAAEADPDDVEPIARDA